MPSLDKYVMDKYDMESAIVDFDVSRNKTNISKCWTYGLLIFWIVWRKFIRIEEEQKENYDGQFPIETCSSSPKFVEMKFYKLNFTFS